MEGARNLLRYHALIGALQRFFLLKKEKIELLLVFYFHIAQFSK
jgi:hypothetical protein